MVAREEKAMNVLVTAALVARRSREGRRIDCQVSGVLEGGLAAEVRDLTCERKFVLSTRMRTNCNFK